MTLNSSDKLFVSKFDFVSESERNISQSVLLFGNCHIQHIIESKINGKFILSIEKYSLDKSLLYLIYVEVGKIRFQDSNFSDLPKHIFHFTIFTVSSSTKEPIHRTEIVVLFAVAIVPKINSIRRNSSCTWKGQASNKVSAWHDRRSSIFSPRHVLIYFLTEPIEAIKCLTASPRKLHSTIIYYGWTLM